MPARPDDLVTRTVLRLLAPDLPRAVQLANVVGWPDVLSDWRVVSAAGVIFAIDSIDGSLVGTGVLCDFGEVAFLAKMLVRPDLQRRGIGRTILESCLNAARPGALAALSATDSGRPLYEAFGFRRTATVRVVRGVLTTAGSEPLPAISDADMIDVIALDRASAGCDRTKMLHARRTEAVRTACVRDESGALSGFAMATLQGALTMVGPVIALRPEIASCLVHAVAPIGTEMRLDVLDTHDPWRVSLGLPVVTERTWMTMNGAPMPGQRARVFALASQAFG